MDETNKAPSHAHAQHMGKGVFYGVLGAITFTLMSLSAKLISDTASVTTILFARYTISLVLLLPWVLRNPKKALYTSAPGTIISRSLFTLLALGCFFYALKYISLSNALLLNNTYPLFIPLFFLLSGGHRTPRKVWGGIFFGFIGVAFVLTPGADLFESASLIALTSAIFGAIAIVIIRKLTRTTPVVQILFYNFSICFIVTGILLPFGWQPLDTRTILYLCGVGVFGAAYQLFSTLSYAKAPVRITSSLMYLCILFGAIADYLIWHHTPNAFTLAGMLCIILGGIATIYYGQKELMKQPK